MNAYQPAFGPLDKEAQPEMATDKELMDEAFSFGNRVAARAETIANKADERLTGHELLCAERYTKLEFGHAAIVGRASRIEYLLYGVMFFLLIGDGSIIEIVKRLTMKGG